MAIYSLAILSTNQTTATPLVELIAGPNLGFTLLEFCVTVNQFGLAVMGLGRPAAIGITPTSPITLMAEDGNNTTTCTAATAVAWGTPPTAPTAFFRRWSANNQSYGTGQQLFTNISVLKTQSLVAWIISSGACNHDCWFVVDE